MRDYKDKCLDVTTPGKSVKIECVDRPQVTTKLPLPSDDNTVTSTTHVHADQTTTLVLVPTHDRFIDIFDDDGDH